MAQAGSAATVLGSVELALMIIFSGRGRGAAWLLLRQAPAKVAVHVDCAQRLATWTYTLHFLVLTALVKGIVHPDMFMKQHRRAREK